MTFFGIVASLVAEWVWLQRWPFNERTPVKEKQKAPATEEKVAETEESEGCCDAPKLAFGAVMVHVKEQSWASISPGIRCENCDEIYVTAKLIAPVVKADTEVHFGSVENEEVSADDEDDEIESDDNAPDLSAACFCNDCVREAKERQATLAEVAEQKRKLSVN